MAGTLTYSDFKVQCNSFVEKSNILNDGWINRISKHGSCPEYIAKKTIVTSKDKSKQKSDDDIEFEGCIAFDDHDDVSEKVPRCQDESIFLEHQVLYSESYNVPVLYFFASTSNGRNLNLDEVWNQVPATYQDALSDKWSFITQTEHPLLGCPVFFVHPCNTAKMMQNLAQSKEVTESSSSRYLLTWLSAVGPVTGLKLRMEYFT